MLIDGNNRSELTCAHCIDLHCTRAWSNNPDFVLALAKAGCKRKFMLCTFRVKYDLTENKELQVLSLLHLMGDRKL